jgi:hypothetical protein
MQKYIMKAGFLTGRLFYEKSNPEIYAGAS